MGASVSLRLSSSTQNGIEPFLLTYLKAYLRAYIMQHSKKGSVPYITMPMLESFPIPISSPEEQARIVAILDKFDALTNSLTEGLPREIERFFVVSCGT